MVGSVGQRRFHADHLVSGQHAFFHTFTQPRFDRREILLRYRAAEDRLRKDHLIAVARFKFNEDMAVLSRTAGLLFMLAFCGNRSAYRFTVLDFRFCRIDFHLVFRFQLA